MSTKQPKTETSSPLGSTVRQLALDAQSWRLGLDRDEIERLRLVCRIDRLACSLGDESHRPLRRWLENLRRELSRDASSVLSV